MVKLMTGHREVKSRRRKKRGTNPTPTLRLWFYIINLLVFMCMHFESKSVFFILRYYYSLEYERILSTPSVVKTRFDVFFLCRNDQNYIGFMETPQIERTFCSPFVFLEGKNYEWIASSERCCGKRKRRWKVNER